MAEATAPRRHAELGLVWGVRTSFVDYIRGSRDGSITLDEEAAITPDAEFHFPLDAYNSTSEANRFAFRGAVRFRAHYGFLDIRLHNPRLVLAGTTGELAVADHRGGWMHLARLVLPLPSVDSEVTMWRDTAASLTEAGTELFGDTYGSGEELAPLTIRVPTATVRANAPA